MQLRLQPDVPARCRDGARGRWRWPGRRPHRHESVMRLGQQDADHQPVSGALSRMPDTNDHGLFDGRLGAYSATCRPARAGTSMAMPRACPSFSVAPASLLTKVFLHRRLMGCMRMDGFGQSVVQLAKAGSQIGFAVGADSSCSDETQTVALTLNDPPPGVTKAGINANDAHEIGHGVFALNFRSGDRRLFGCKSARAARISHLGMRENHAAHNSCGQVCRCIPQAS